jgi:NADH dehydrogenase FAD-containing subunit
VPGWVYDTVLSATDGFLYAPLLPDVAVGTVDPRSAVVPLAPTLHGARMIRGHATAFDLDARTVTYADPVRWALAGRRHDDVSFGSPVSAALITNAEDADG